MSENIEEKIQAAIESVEKPDFVVSVSFQLSEDWSGDPAAMVLVLLKDREKPDRAYWDDLVPYDQALVRVVRQSGFLPYLNFRMESEQRELDREKVAIAA